MNVNISLKHGFNPTWINIPKDNIDPFCRYKRKKIQVTHIKKGNGQTVFENLPDICKQIDRPIELISLYFKKKLKMNVFMDKKLKKYKINSTVHSNQLDDLLEAFIML